MTRKGLALLIGNIFLAAALVATEWSAATAAFFAFIWFMVANFEDKLP